MMLVLGLGNSLLGDDAVGPRVVELLAARDPLSGRVAWRDGGTLGLSLLPEIEAAEAVVVVDASRCREAPGAVRVFEGEHMDRQLGGRHHSAHELALADLMGAAALTGSLPQRRALVAVEPASTELGLAMSPAVDAALPTACQAVLQLLERWSVPATGPDATACDAFSPHEEYVHVPH